jgi:hypothetical protein
MHRSCTYPTMPRHLYSWLPPGGVSRIAQHPFKTSLIQGIFLQNMILLVWHICLQCPKKNNKSQKQLAFTWSAINSEGCTQEMQSGTSDDDSAAELLNVFARYG